METKPVCQWPNTFQLGQISETWLPIRLNDNLGMLGNCHIRVGIPPQLQQKINVFHACSDYAHNSDWMITLKIRQKKRQ